MPTQSCRPGGRGSSHRRGNLSTSGSTPGWVRVFPDSPAEARRRTCRLPGILSACHKLVASVSLCHQLVGCWMLVRMEPASLRSTELRYCTGLGQEVVTTLAEVDSPAVLAGLPVRDFTWRPRQGNYPGAGCGPRLRDRWSATRACSNGTGFCLPTSTPTSLRSRVSPFGSAGMMPDSPGGTFPTTCLNVRTDRCRRQACTAVPGPSSRSRAVLDRSSLPSQGLAL